MEDDEARKRAIELLMRTDRPRYFRDEGMQREYLQMLEREEGRQQGGEGKTLAPGADVSIPVKRGTVGQERRDRVGALTETPYLDAADSKRIDDSRVLSEFTADNEWIPGAQYAQIKLTPATGTVYDKDGHQYYQGGGHHEVPRGVYEKWNLRSETEKVFKDATTGPIPPWEGRTTPDGIRIGNRWTEAHREYNKAIKELSEDFFKRHNIRPQDMTPDQARTLSKEIRETPDPRIRVFNDMMRLLRRLFRAFPTRGME